MTLTRIRPPTTCRRSWLLVLLCALGFVAAIPGPAADAQSVLARGATHEDFGRLVFDFAAPVAAQVVAEGRRMELQFDRPSKFGLGGALANLKDYIAGVKPSSDGRRLEIEFTAPVTWRAFNDGLKVAVDFALADGSGQQQFDNGPEAATGEIATGPVRAAAAPILPAKAVVQLRAGEHQGFSRLAFDWPKDVGYELTQSGDQAVLRFASPATIDLGRVIGDLPPRLQGIDLTPTANGVAVRLQLKPGMLLRDFRSGRTVVLDIYDQTAANIPPSQPAQPPQATQPPEATQLVDVPPQTQPDLAPAAPSVASIAAATPGQEIGAGQEPAVPGTGLVPQMQIALPEAPMQPAATAGATGPGVAAPVAPAAPATFEPPRVAPRPVNVKVTAQKLRDGAILYFDWPKPVALAVFRRGGALWLVFDAPGRADLQALQRVAPAIGKAEPVASPFSLALRLVGGAAASPQTATEGTRWKIALRPGVALVPTQPLQQKRETLNNGGTSLLVQAIASGAAVELADPTDHGRLAVTPEQLSGLGIARESDWPDFKLLPSYQGVVVERLTDRVAIQAGPNGVVITTPPAASAALEAQAPAPPGPATTAGTEAAATTNPAATPAATTATPAATPPQTAAVLPAAPGAAKPLRVAGGLFDLPKWRRGGEATFMVDLQQLKDALDQAAPADRTAARLDLAEFYLANGFGPEAGGPIDLIRHDDRTAEDNPLIMALAAAAKTMSGEYDAATRLLAMPALQGVPEANLMRAVIAAKRGDSAAAAKLFGEPLPDLGAYPKPFRTQVRLLAAQALLDTGDPLTAQNFLDPIKSDAPDPDAAAHAAYLDGVRQLKLGQKTEALATWQALVDSPIDEIKAKARFAVISEQLAEKQIAPKDAVAQLEALRYLWRGDTFEFDLLYKLGHLYFDAGQPRRGLITLRQAATHFPDHPLAKQAADDMTTEFRKLYLQGGADQLSPLTAIALYDEFRELTPAGADGDRMIDALADRLVKVDLLDRAGDLLERQVKTRLSGADKVAAGTRLAAIRVLDDKPDLALAALAESEDPAATPELQAERRRLQARALFDTGDTLKGLGLVRDDASLEGLWLKSDMYWKLREWPAAAEALGQLIAAEQAKRAAESTAGSVAVAASTAEAAKNPASVLDRALAQANAAAAADAANAAPAGDAQQSPAPAQPPGAAGAAPAGGTAGSPAAPSFDPVLARLVLNRAVALSLAGDRRGLKELGRGFGKEMDTSSLADSFKVLTSPDTGLTESITAQMKSVKQLGVFVEEYKKLLKAKSLSVRTEPKPDLGPLAPLDAPPTPAGTGPAPAGTPQTADQSPVKPAGQ